MSEVINIPKELWHSTILVKNRVRFLECLRKGQLLEYYKVDEVNKRVWKQFSKTGTKFVLDLTASYHISYPIVLTILKYYGIIIMLSGRYILQPARKLRQEFSKQCGPLNAG